MEINKILFEQLAGTKGINNPFEDFDVNNDGVINEEDATVSAANQALSQQITNLLSQVDADEDVEILGDFVEDEIPTNTAILGNTATNAATTQGNVAVMQLEINKLNTEQEKLQDEISEKEKEIEKKQKEIENKQEEYDSLVSQAQSTKDNSQIDAINSLSAEIKSLSIDISGLNSEISALQSEYNANATRLTSMSATLQMQQSSLTETVNQTNALKTVNSVTAADGVNGINGATSTTPSTETTSAKFVRKTQEEYTQELYSKFDALWEKFGNDIEKVNQYVKDNMSEFTDIDGDGRLTVIDSLILSNAKLTDYTRNKLKENGMDARTAAGVEASSYGRTLHYAIQRSGSKSNSLSLSDIEDFYRLGGKNIGVYGVNWGHYDNVHGQGFINNSNTIDYVKIAQEENWEERLRNLYSQYNILGGANSHSLEDNIKYIQKISDFIKANPQNASYAPIAIKYQDNQEYNAKILQKAQETDWTALAEEKNSDFEKRYKEAMKNGDYKSSFNSYLSAYKKFNKNLKVADTPSSYADYVRATVFKYATGLDPVKTSCMCSASLLKEAYLENNLKKNIPNTPDITGDGKIDANDYESFSTEVDLDGDGTVSNDERTALNNVKDKLAKKLCLTLQSAGYYNQNSIDDVINYLNTDLNETLSKMVDSSVNFYEGFTRTNPDGYVHSENDFIEGKDPYKNRIVSGSPFVMMTLGRFGMYQIMYNGYMDGTGKMTTPSELKSTLTCEKLNALLKEVVLDKKTLPNTYLHYVQSANLSKSELQSILDKINAAPSSVQSQLAEVKKVVETRLANLNN